MGWLGCAVLSAVRGLGSLRSLDRRALLFIALSGVAGTGSWLCYFRALQLGDHLPEARFGNTSQQFGRSVLEMSVRGSRRETGCFCR